MPDLTRRRLLGSAAGAIAGGGALSLLPPSVQKAVAAGPATSGSLADIKHVVLLMQENRSFDHYFGTLKGVRGFTDPKAIRLSTGRSVFYQPDDENPQRYLLPFHLDTHESSAQAIPSTSHAWSVQHDAWHGGAMDRWLPAHRKADGDNGPYVMGYYTRKDIPFQFALAEAFTICDNYFCSVMGPTWPNRLMWMTGTIDPGGTKGGPVIANSAPKPYRWTTYAERLQAAGVSWRVYQQQDNYPFVHALDTASRTAVCVGLPVDWTKPWVSTAHLALVGGKLRIEANGGRTRVLVDTRTFAVTTP